MLLFLENFPLIARSPLYVQRDLKASFLGPMKPLDTDYVPEQPNLEQRAPVRAQLREAGRQPHLQQHPVHVDLHPRGCQLRRGCMFLLSNLRIFSFFLKYAHVSDTLHKRKPVIK